MIRLVLLLLVSTLLSFTHTGCSTLPGSASASDPAAAQTKGLPILQGLTGATATQMAVVANTDRNLTFRYFAEGASPIPLNSAVVSSKGSDVVVHRLAITGLALGTVYELEVLEGGLVIDRRKFRSLDLKRQTARVASASCLYDLLLKESRPMWKALIDSKPDLLLLIGDNVYAEAGGGRFKSPLDEAALWIRYVETFQALDYYRTPILIPTLATWDDHDYGMRDGDSTNPHRLEAEKVHKAFFPQNVAREIPEFQRGPGVSSAFDAFGFRFLLLDDRSFRTPNALKGAKNETHFGPEQEKWLIENVKRSKVPVWLISGDQWFGRYHRFESYEGNHPNSFKRLLNSIANSTSVLFMSGDRHLSEVMKIEKQRLGYETFEITSSPLHSSVYPSGWDKAPNPRQLMGAAQRHNFNVLEITPPTADGSVEVKGAAIAAEGAELFRYNLVLKRGP